MLSAHCGRIRKLRCSRSAVCSDIKCNANFADDKTCDPQSSMACSLTTHSLARFAEDLDTTTVLVALRTFGRAPPLSLYYASDAVLDLTCLLEFNISLQSPGIYFHHTRMEVMVLLGD